MLSTLMASSSNTYHSFGFTPAQKTEARVRTSDVVSVVGRVAVVKCMQMTHPIAAGTTMNIIGLTPMNNTDMLHDTNTSDYKNFSSINKLTRKTIKKMNKGRLDCAQQSNLINDHIMQQVKYSAEVRSGTNRVTGAVYNGGNFIAKHLRPGRARLPYTFTPVNIAASLWDVCVLSIYRNFLFIKEVLQCYVRNGRLLFKYKDRQAQRNGTVILSHNNSFRKDLWWTITRKKVITSQTKREAMTFLLFSLVMIIATAKQLFEADPADEQPKVSKGKILLRLLVWHAWISANCYNLDSNNILYGLLRVP